MTQERTVAQVIDIARQWVTARYAHRPDFFGAHLVGSLHHMPLDAPFADYRDVDLAIILDSITEQAIDEANEQGLIIEAIVVPASRYTSAEKLLADACNASILAGENSILLDPKNQLAPIARQVKDEFSKRKWVTARRDSMLNEAQKAFNTLTRAQNAPQALFAIGELNMYLIATLTTAHLVALTHRRNMLQLKKLLTSEQEKEFFEKLHQLLGSSHFTPADAEHLLTQAVDAFDYAVTIHKTPVPYDHKLAPCIRPYLLEGTREMFAENGHREAISWIALFLMISCAAIQADGDDASKTKYLPGAKELLQTMGLHTPEYIKERILFGQKLLEETKQITDELILHFSC